MMVQKVYQFGEGVKKVPVPGRGRVDAILKSFLPLDLPQYARANVMRVKEKSIHLMLTPSIMTVLGGCTILSWMKG